MARVQAALRTEHPQLLAQLETTHALLEAWLLPSSVERLLGDVGDLITPASAPPGPPDKLPALVLDALGRIDAHHGLSAGTGAAAAGGPLAASRRLRRRLLWRRARRAVAVGPRRQARRGRSALEAEQRRRR